MSILIFNRYFNVFRNIKHFNPSPMMTEIWFWVLVLVLGIGWPVAGSTASRHSWMGQETSWKYLNNLNRHFHMDDLVKMRRSCKVRLTFSWITTKCQAFQTQSMPMWVSTDPCANNHWIRPRWYRGRWGVISKQLSLNSWLKSHTER